jgi:uncharacterized protein YndB with AHSA1/START domain
LSAPELLAQEGGEISHADESIHQEVVFKTGRKRVYEALTDAKQFERVVQLSDAAKTMIKPGAPATQISTQAGGAFSTFGGLIVGRQLELVPGERIVQAWRPAYWEPGIYSIVKFELKGDGGGTRLTLDHKAFPIGDAKSLLEGWNKNYWAPLAKYLAGN